MDPSIIPIMHLVLNKCLDKCKHQLTRSTFSTLPFKMDTTKSKQFCLQQDCRSHQKFKSPVSASPKVTNSGESTEDIKRQIEKAQETCHELDQEIEKLLDEGLIVEELDLHIDTLHEYNEIKDATQVVLGRIAVIDGVTTKELHERYDLPFGE